MTLASLSNTISTVDQNSAISINRVLICIGLISVCCIILFQFVIGHEKLSLFLFGSDNYLWADRFFNKLHIIKLECYYQTV